MTSPGPVQHGSKRPILVFVVSLCVMLGLLQLVLAADVVTEKVIPAYLRGWARACAATLSVFGEGASAVETAVNSPRYSINIKRGCDAIQPTALLIFGVLAAPVRWRLKIPGLLVGTAFMMVMNLVRVVSLFYVGIHFPTAFDTMHEDVWQAVFIILSVLSWGAWAVWAARRTANPPRARE
jgi:exosortase/archaeosortase family protein